MITDKIYREQWLRLEGALGYEIYKGSIPVWKKELDDNGYSDERLVKGIDRIINRLSDGSLKPRDISLGTILGACKTAYIPPQLPDRTFSQITDPHQHRLSPYAQGCCNMIRELTTGLIDIMVYKQKHAELNIKYGMNNLI